MKSLFTKKLLLILLAVSLMSIPVGAKAGFFDVSNSFVKLLKVQMLYDIKLFQKIDSQPESPSTVSLLQTQNDINARIDVIQKHYTTPVDLTLDIPFHRQEKKLSCEIATLRMALLYYGMDISESELESIMPYDGSQDIQNNIWGDPQVGYVGYINGNQLRRTGYGVLWEPIAEMAQIYKPQSFSFENQSLDFILHHMLQEHAVIIWGVMGAEKRTPEDISWYTKDGRRIQAYNGEHTWVLKGFSGSIQNPEFFTVLDPLYGEYKVSRANFEKIFSLFNYSGVVVR